PQSGNPRPDDDRAGKHGSLCLGLGCRLGNTHLGSIFLLKYPVPTVSESVLHGRGDVNAAASQLTAESLGTALWIGWSGSILIPSCSAVPPMTPIVIVVSCSTNLSRAIRRGLSRSDPSHQSVADAAEPNAAKAASWMAAGSRSISRSSLLNISAIASV